MNIDLTEWQARILIQGLKELEAKWTCINRTSEDEDMKAEYANDLIELGMVKDQLTNGAVNAFGPAVTEFDRSLV